MDDRFKSMFTFTDCIPIVSCTMRNVPALAGSQCELNNVFLDEEGKFVENGISLNKCLERMSVRGGQKVLLDLTFCVSMIREI